MFESVLSFWKGWYWGPWRVPSSPGNRGDNAEKKSHNIISLHLPQICPCSEWHESTLSPIVPFFSTLRSLGGEGKKNNEKPEKGLYWKKYCSPVSLTTQKSLRSVVNTVELGQQGGTANVSSSHLISRSAALRWCCTNVHHLVYSQGGIKIVATQMSRQAKWAL